LDSSLVNFKYSQYFLNLIDTFTLLHLQLEIFILFLYLLQTINAGKKGGTLKKKKGDKKPQKSQSAVYAGTGVVYQ
jgi:hypothetical protein